jgi:Cu-Zn family superoxide dismutase
MLRTRNLSIGIAGVALAAGLATTVNAGSDSKAVGAEATIMNAAGAEIGFAKFTEDGDGVVHVNIKVSGLSAGKHGVHIHETGSCASTAIVFGGAGGHYSPADGAHANHRGDLPNLIVNDDLQGHLNTTTERVTLSDGPTTVFDVEVGKVGSAIMIHANEDDFGPVANGNSGDRVACGVIVLK